jgi:hypothetical protein
VWLQSGTNVVSSDASAFTGSTDWIAGGGSVTIRAGASRLENGNGVVGGLTRFCAGNYDETGTAIADPPGC